MRSRLLSEHEIALAEDSRSLIRAKDVPVLASESLREARRRIGREAYVIRRRMGIFTHGRRFTVTLRGSVWLQKGFRDLSTFSQAMILWHELVHIYQRKMMGHFKFELRYLNPHTRWALEVPAYRMSIRCAERMSDGKFDSKAFIDAKLASFRSGYQMSAIPFSQFVRETSRIWKKESLEPS